VALTVKADAERADAEPMPILIVLVAMWVTFFVAAPMLFRFSVRNDPKDRPRTPTVGGIEPLPVQILFTDVHEDHVRLDCVQLADTDAHEAGFPLTLRIARPEHPALDAAVKRTLIELAERLAEVELRFAVHRGEPQVRIARDRTSMTLDLGTAA
jgi:hypothetical protein